MQLRFELEKGETRKKVEKKAKGWRVAACSFTLPPVFCCLLVSAFEA